MWYETILKLIIVVEKGEKNIIYLMCPIKYGRDLTFSGTLHMSGLEKYCTYS